MPAVSITLSAPPPVRSLISVTASAPPWTVWVAPSLPAGSGLVRAAAAGKDRPGPGGLAGSRGREPAAAEPEARPGVPLGALRPVQAAPAPVSTAQPNSAAI